MKLRLSLVLECDSGELPEQACIDAIERHMRDLGPFEIPVINPDDEEEGWVPDDAAICVEEVEVENSELVEA